MHALVECGGCYRGPLGSHLLATLEAIGLITDRGVEIEQMQPGEFRKSECEVAGVIDAVVTRLVLVDFAITQVGVGLGVVERAGIVHTSYPLGLKFWTQKLQVETGAHIHSLVVLERTARVDL